MLRRDFMKLTAGLFAVPSLGYGALIVPKEANLVALFADTHINPGGYQRTTFHDRVTQLLALNPRPANLLIYGDFAFLFGEKEDYKAAREELVRVEEAGIKWHVAFGNHDRREAFFDLFPERIQQAPLVPDRYVSIVETEFVDFILLDSLDEGKTPGTIDDAQRDWLTKAIPQRKKPFLLGAHHSLLETKVGDMMEKSPLSAGYIHGHHHYWNPSHVGTVQSLCLPSTGHWGDIGFVLADLSQKEVCFRLEMLDHYKPKPLDEPKPEWLEEIKRKKGATLLVPLPG